MNIKKFLLPICIVIFITLTAEECATSQGNRTAKVEQAHTEANQSNLIAVQPPPDISWSLERDNLIKRFRLENDRSVIFYMYLFIEGSSEPIGYYQVNKISSVNSQLTNPEQLVYEGDANGDDYHTLPSPAEDGSYGSNGDGVFGFTPEEIYIEHNMKYIASTVPLTFRKTVNRLTILNVETEKQLKELMLKIDKK